MSIADWGRYTWAKSMARVASRTITRIRSQITKNTKVVSNIQKQQREQKTAMLNYKNAQLSEYTNNMWAAMSQASSQQNGAGMTEYQNLVNQQTQFKQRLELYYSSYETMVDEQNEQYLNHFTQIGYKLEAELAQAQNDEKMYDDLAKSSKESYDKSMNSIFGNNKT